MSWQNLCGKSAGRNHLCEGMPWFAGLLAYGCPVAVDAAPQARCMRPFCLRMGSHSLPIVLGRRNGTPRDQRLCQQCDLHAVHVRASS